MNKKQFDIFDDNNLGGVRKVFDEKKGKIWYVAKDVCKLLELKNVSRECEYMFHDEKAIFSIPETGKNGIVRYCPHLVLSTEAIIRLIMRSNKNEARRFQEWAIPILNLAIKDNLQLKDQE